MAGEVLYRLLQGEGIQIVEDATTKTVTISVPGLSTKLGPGDVSLATQLIAGVARLATNAEVQAGTNADKIVTPAGLAAAVQSDSTDATSGRLMRVGAFGLGGQNQVTGGNFDDDRRTGFYYMNSGINSPGGNGFLTHHRLNLDNQHQFFHWLFGSRMYFRGKSGGAWGAWRELFHTGNFDPDSKANTSGSYPSLSVGSASQVGGQTAEMLAPPGMVAHFARSTAPSGWLVANGAAVSRSTYAALFSAIGTAFGAGNGSSTFNLPDLRGMFLRSWDNGRGIDTGRTFGSSQNSSNLSHGHTASSGTSGAHAHGGSTSNAGTHTHSVQVDAAVNDLGSKTGNNGVDRMTSTYTTSASGDHTHTISTDTQGSHSHTVTITASGDGEARPINVALLACIKH